MPRVRFRDLGLSANDLNNEVVIPELNEQSRVANHLGLPLHDLTLRPGQHRRVSFRSTPGTSVEIELKAHEWFDLDILNDSRSSPGNPPQDPVAPRPLGAGDVLDTTIAVAEPTIGNPSSPVTPNITRAPVLANRMRTSANSEMITSMRAAMLRPVGGVGILNPGGVFDPFDPLEPFDPLNPVPPIEIPPRPTLPVEVVVSVRDGDELGRVTLQATAGALSPDRFEVPGINVDDVIDVTFINPNEQAVICSHCYVRARRRVRTTVTRMDTEMILRAFNGAVDSLSPDISIADGELRLKFEGDLAGHLDIEDIRKDLNESFTGGAKFCSDDLEIMALYEMIPQVIELFRYRISRKMMRAAGASTANVQHLSDHRQSHVDVPAFLEAVAEAYFDSRAFFVEEVHQLITPENANSSLRQRLRDVLLSVLKEFPMLADPHSHLPADPAFVFGYSLKEIHGELGPIGVEVPHIRMKLFMVLNHDRKREPAPHGDLPLDRLTVGTVRPILHLVLDIADFDVDIEVPWYLTVATGGLANLAAFIVDQGLEELADYLAGQAERKVPAALHEALASRASEYGELISEHFGTITNLDHRFHRVAATRQQIAVSMIDPDQLRIPHDPNWAVEPSRVVGIEQELPPVQPIDHGSGPAVVFGLSPEQRLDRIDHLVFVMMENRSFDHMLGYLSHPDHGGRTDVDGLDGSIRELGGDYTGTRTQPLAGPHPQFRPNLPHDNDSIVRQINNGRMDAFVSEYGRKLMRSSGLNTTGVLNDAERALRFQTPDVVTTYDRLAREYTICDRWFCSVPAGTYPNRACYYSGVTPSLSNDGIFESLVTENFGYFSELTLFDVLDHVGVDWKVYESDISFLRMYRNFRLDQDRIRPISEMSDPLPPVTFIDPNFTGFPSAMANNDDQPPTSVRSGQAFIKSVVDFVENSSHWDRTMLVITYDEHGGFADHVPPPGTPGSSHPPGGGIEIPRAHHDASTYGVRVPTFVVSPLVARGGVSHHIFDHASVFRTILQRFAPQHINSKIIPERVRRSRHLGDLLVDQLQIRPPVAVDPQPILSPKAAPRARVTFDTGIDPDDMAYVLRNIGKPTRPR